MRFSMIAVVAAALGLSGCFATDEEVFPTTGGETVQIEEGKYDCVEGDKKMQMDHHFTAVRAGTKTLYTDRTETVVGVYSMHLLQPGLYAAVGANRIRGQGIYLFRPLGKDRFETRLPKLAQVQAAAAKTGVKAIEAEFNSIKLEGPVANQRQFFTEIAHDVTSFEIYASCTLVIDKEAEEEPKEKE